MSTGDADFQVKRIRFMTIAGGALAICLVIAAGLWVIARHAPTNVLRPNHAVIDLFKANTAQFVSYAYAVRSGRLKPRSGGVGVEIPKNLEERGITTVVARKGCVFFEMKGSLGEVTGIAFSSEDRAAFDAIQPPDGPKLLKVEKVQPGWFYFTY
jgi:hypothetical protein